MGRCAPRAEEAVVQTSPRRPGSVQQQNAVAQVVGVGDDRPWMPRPRRGEPSAHVPAVVSRRVVAEDDRHPVRTSSTRRRHRPRRPRRAPHRHPSTTSWPASATQPMTSGSPVTTSTGIPSTAPAIAARCRGRRRRPGRRAWRGQPQTAHFASGPPLTGTTSRPGLRGEGAPADPPNPPGDVLDIPPAGDHNAGDPHPLTEGSRVTDPNGPFPALRLPVSRSPVIRPLLLLFTRREWSGAENLPTEGGYVVCPARTTTRTSIRSWLRALPRRPRPRAAHLGKIEVFEAPVVGRIVRGAETRFLSTASRSGLGRVPRGGGGGRAGGRRRLPRGHADP